MRYGSINDVIAYEVEPALDEPRDFDVEAIAREVSTYDGKGYEVTADVDEFWEAVQRNQTVRILAGVSREYDAYVVVVHGVATRFKTVEGAERFLDENGLRPIGRDRDAYQLVEGAGETTLRINAATDVEVEEWETWN